MNNSFLLENINENQLNPRQKYAIDMMKNGKIICVKWMTLKKGSG